jgi:hypothetical protein
MGDSGQVFPMDIDGPPPETTPAAALQSAAPLAGASLAPPQGVAVLLPERGSKEPKEKLKSAPAKSVPFWRLFTYADKLDVLCIVIGMVGAVAMGVAMPLLTLLFGRLINAFGQNSTNPDELYNEVKKVRS